MKSNTGKTSLSASPLKIPSLILALVILTASSISAQDRKFAFGPGLGIGIGVFNPKGVNEYISNDLSNYITVNEELYLYESVSFVLNFKFKWFDIVPLVEYAIGPKIIVGADESYFFNRFSPGTLADVFIPVGRSGKNALFIGGGAQYHVMTFEGYQANTLGYRAQIGFDLQFGSTNLQPYIAINFAKATDVILSNNSNRDLDYTGGQIGLHITFHKTVYH